ncbi:beta-ketoacyl synthase chain length factor [Aquabacterium sp. OR-4]|uniref:beta-ketoacyl synthase chain length factor n=1 Tax=Aquabacterium sp. OR-4 TaxID=2978127 RepID=UPI0021B4439E|nr:beta-ketoacyl synthase chain length factor [Aquabacterium sp. OR-4]MDT7836736.1 beta-ketoacyl synthase chain length factor [Aquabacterium sp. OR-4]
MLAPAERRRAPDTVALALVAGAAAVAAAGADAAALPSVFVSAHGDLGVNDYMCSTLARTPLLLSPTRFHNSVHNAAAGYWTMATACHETSTALTAHVRSFANGLLAAATQCQADGRAVLLVGYDVNAVGGLASVTHSEGLLAVALVLSPVPGAHSVARLDWQLNDGAAPAPALLSPAAQSLAGNAMADALPLCELLARATAAGPSVHHVNLPLSAQQALALTVTPLHPQ